jgi:putative MATE family efflux protein
MGVMSTILVSRLGAVQTASVGISDSITYIVIALLTACALGGSVFISQAIGRRDRVEALNGACQTMNLTVVVGIVTLALASLFADRLVDIVAQGATSDVVISTEQYLNIIAFSYPALAVSFAGSGILRSVGNSRLPMFSNVLMNVLNIVFSYPLIYGWDGFGPFGWEGYGINGAAYGVTAARWVGAAFILVLLASNRRFSIALRQYIRPFDRNTLLDILGIGIPASVESLMFNIGKLITQMMVAGMGTVAMAGNFITFSALLLINLPGNSLAMAATVLIGQRLGENRPKAAYQEMRLIFGFATALLILFGAISVPLARHIATWYTTDAEVITVVVNLLYFNAVMMPIWAASFVLPSAFKGAKDVTYGMWTAIASMWGCRIFTGYLLGVVCEMGIYGVWIGMFSDWLLRGILYWYRMVSMGWLKRYYIKRRPFD